jgi:hypothetical protein
MPNALYFVNLLNILPMAGITGEKAVNSFCALLLPLRAAGHKELLS